MAPECYVSSHNPVGPKTLMSKDFLLIRMEVK